MDVFPPGTRVSAAPASLRARVTWPILARATGLGEIEGGEIVLVPQARIDDLAPRLAELSQAGISGVVFEYGGIEGNEAVEVPVFTLPEGYDVRVLQAPIERYIGRRRRELFSLDHDMHRLLVDPAIAGTTLQAVVDAAHGAIDRPVLLDRDGEITSAGILPDQVSHELLVRARIAMQRSEGTPEWLPDPSAGIAFPVLAGRERHGIVLLLGGSLNPDQDEVIASSLVSACAIVLLRQARSPVLDLDGLVEAVASVASLEPGAGHQVVAFIDESSDFKQVSRATELELGSRNLRSVVGQHARHVIAVVNSNVPVTWEHVLSGIAQRLGSRDVRVGIGSSISSGDHIRSSAEEAIQALRHSSERVVAYRSVQVASLLAAEPGWKRFADDRLGALLEDQRSGGGLYMTLQTYLAVGRNAIAAARELHVHRNTLLYRLRRISDILDVDLADPATLFEIELALAVTHARR